MKLQHVSKVIHPKYYKHLKKAVQPRTTDTHWLNPKFFEAQIQIPIPNKHGQGTHSTKMGADKSAENTPNAPKLSAQIVCPSPNVWEFDEKRLHWESGVRIYSHLSRKKMGWFLAD